MPMVMVAALPLGRGDLATCVELDTLWRTHGR